MVRPENHTVSPMASSRWRHHVRVSRTSKATLSAWLMEIIPLDAPQSAPSTPSETSEPRAPLTTSPSVLLSSEAASAGSTRAM